ncbi:MAG: YnbE family lipoprotein [Novosphingobium sp.]|nr:YnbE family lipoprotein [Novosphingobium sp.]
MKMRQLTGSEPAATTGRMQGRQQAMRRSFLGTSGAAMMVMGGALACSGCVSVSAPDKPIVIELNINIKQEVVYKLDKGVQDMIQDNSGIF